MSFSLSELLGQTLDPTDPSHRDMETVRAVIPFLQFLRDVYFRAEGEGSEHIPTDRNFITVGVPVWSPTGTHLVYYRGGDLMSGDPQDTWRTTASGKAKVNLTGDIDTSIFTGTTTSPIAWR